MSPPSWPPHHLPIPPLWVITEHRPERPMPYSSSSSFYTWQCTYKNPSLPAYPTPLSCPASCPPVCSLHLYLCTHPANSFLCTSFLDSTYMYKYMIFFNSLYVQLYFLEGWERGWGSITIQRTDGHKFSKTERHPPKFRKLNKVQVSKTRILLIYLLTTFFKEDK